MWSVPFTEYVQFDGVKEGIKRTKTIKKEQSSVAGVRHGQLVEETIYSILTSTGMEVKHTTPQMDVGFGADLLVSYKEDNKNYSFYVDITSTRKNIVQYFSFTGETTDNPKNAFSYSTEYGNFYFGVKEKHGNWFFYEKPVVVLYIENFVPCTGMALSHITNIRNILMSLNAMLVRKGYGARASKLIRPNISRFRKEFEVSLDKY